MFILIPTGHEQATVRRLPWVTITIIALNVVLFLGVGLKAASIERRATRQLERVFEYWREHPYLQIPPALLGESLSPREQEQVKMLREAFQQAAPENAQEREHQQGELNRLAQEAFATRDKHPFFSRGLIPAHPTRLAFITCMFMHAGWLHLVSNSCRGRQWRTFTGDHCLLPCTWLAASSPAWCTSPSSPPRKCPW